MTLYREIPLIDDNGNQYDVKRVPVSIDVEQATQPLPTGASTSANQTNGLQKTQLVDINGDTFSEENPLIINEVDPANRTSFNTVFGEKIIGTRKPNIASQFQYGFPSSAANTVMANGGSISIVESMLVLSTGTNIAGSASIRNKKALRYIPGHEAYTYFTAVLSSPKQDSYQISGIFDSLNGFYIGYIDTNFVVGRRRAGIDYTITIIPENVFTGYDPTKGNVYKISFGYLGFAPITFEVMKPNGDWVILHKIEYPNSSTGTHILNTNLPPMAKVGNTGNNTDIVAKIGSFTAGIVGGAGEDPTARRFSYGVSAVAISSGNTMVITFRSKTTFNSLVNYISSIVTLISFNTDMSKSSRWQLIKGITITNTPTWNDVNKNDSTIEYSTDATVTEGTGTTVFEVPLGKVDRILLDRVEIQEIELYPQETITLIITAPAGNTGTVDLAFRWKELF